MSSTKTYKRAFLRFLLWLGLALCVGAMLRYWEESTQLIRLATPARLLLLLGLLVIVWGLAIRHWQFTVRACAGVRLESRDAARHLAYLVLGKYVPGGVWGFLARHAESTHGRQGNPMLVAGVVEQSMSLASLALVAAVAILAARTHQWPWLALVMLVPTASFATIHAARWLMKSGARLLSRFCGRAVGVAGMVADPRILLVAAVVSVVQQTMVMAVVLVVAGPAFDLDPLGALGVAGSYGLAAAGGIMAVVAPGGILVREALFVGLAHPWLAAPEAIALGAGLRLVFTAFDLLCGVLARLMWPRSAS